MPKEGNKVLKYNHGEIEDPLFIFAGWESLRERTDTCHSNPKNSSMTKLNKPTASSYSLFRNC